MRHVATSRPRSAPPWGTALGALLALATGLALGCAPPARESGTDRQAPAREREARAGGLVFTNRVWVVEASNAVAVGSVYVFLGDRTLVLTSPGGTPAFGRWVFERGELAIVEDGLAYPVDILQAKGDHLRLRIHGPGDPVTLELRDARPDWIGEESRR